MPPRHPLTRRQWLSAAGLLAISGCAGRSKDEPIWVGHIAGVGTRGESAINGMQQMLADLREKEFAVGGRTLGVRHVEAKDKTRARAEASRFLAVNRVACLIVGPEVDGVGEVCAIARAHDAIAVVLGGTDDRALARQGVWLGVGAQMRAEMLARYAKGRKGDAVEGESRTLRIRPDDADLPEKGRAWAERYEKRFGRPPDDNALLGAEAVELIADGLKAVGDDRQKLATNLEDRTTVVGLTGPIVWQRWRTIRPVWVERVVEGKRVGVERVPTNE
jgi:ABC-type branched-subunit amino acid transport system substrate-binding protein